MSRNLISDTVAVETREPVPEQLNAYRKCMDITQVTTFERHPWVLAFFYE